MEIKNIVGRYILDSRGNPTVEADVWLACGVFGRASVPSGASTGVHEAHELRDGGKAFGGLGVQKALQNIAEKIAPNIQGMRADDQFAIDKKMIELDGTANKSSLGANAILAVSLAVAHAASKARGVLLYSHINDIAGGVRKSIPMPMMNILNGGKHAAGSTDIQETMIIPIGAQNYRQAVQMGTEVFHKLGELLKKAGYATTVGDEGGYAPSVKNGNQEAIDYVLKAITEAGYEPAKDIAIALDVASSEIYQDGKYNLKTEGRLLDSEQMIAWYKQLMSSYPIISIEDGLAEDDWQGWQKLTSELGDKLQLVGDDLLVTNTERLSKAIDQKAGNSILIKPNQIGTLTETLRAIQMAQANNWRSIVSHRSGETEDTTIAHIAIGTGAGQIKTGSLSRSERTAKHNELIRLELIDSSLGLNNPFF